MTSIEKSGDETKEDCCRTEQAKNLSSSSSGLCVVQPLLPQPPQQDKDKETSLVVVGCCSVHEDKKSEPPSSSSLSSSSSDTSSIAVVVDGSSGGGKTEKMQKESSEKETISLSLPPPTSLSSSVTDDTPTTTTTDNKNINKTSNKTNVSKDPKGLVKEDENNLQLKENTCPQQQPSSSLDSHSQKHEGKNVTTTNDWNNQQVNVTSDDRSLKEMPSTNDPGLSEMKPAATTTTTTSLATVSTSSVSMDPLNPIHHKTDPSQMENLKHSPIVAASGKPNDIVTSSESSLHSKPSPTPAIVPPSPPPESKLDNEFLGPDSTQHNLKPSTDCSLQIISGGGPPQPQLKNTDNSSALNQPLEKEEGNDDDSGDNLKNVTPNCSNAMTEAFKSPVNDSLQANSSKDQVGASQTVEHSNKSNDESLNKPSVQGQDHIAAIHSLPQKGSPELTNLSSARSEVPKKSENDATIQKATLSLGDTVRDGDEENSSKRSDTDSTQDVTPSDSLSIPSDRDLECVDINSLGVTDNDTGAASLKVTKDGVSTSSSSSSVLSIYHLKWIHFKSKKVPVITQNENGPCPLLAIMNVLLLQGRVTLESGLELITSEQLMDHLDECILENVPKTASEDVQLNYQQNMQDGMAVIHKLQTGLDVNVRFTGVQDFEYTTECIIFDLFGISLYHGWLVDPQSLDIVSAIGMCSYNQLVEKIIVQKTSEDIKLFTEATIAENFLEKTASQLTYHGLCELSTTVKEGELCVFFRNNHFSTLYRHKNELFLLVTDQGFLNEGNVVWETLSSVEGDCYFVDAEFNTYTKPDPVSGSSVVLPSIVPIGSDQQIDQDYLVALSLEREQQLQREVWASQAGGSGISGGAGGIGPGLGPGAAVPDPLRGHRLPLSDLELAKKLQDEENQRVGAASAAASSTTGSNRRNPRMADTSSGLRRTRDREKEKDGCFIL